jgi:hypothetical protein
MSCVQGCRVPSLALSSEPGAYARQAGTTLILFAPMRRAWLYPDSSTLREYQFKAAWRLMSMPCAVCLLPCAQLQDLAVL